MKPADFYKYRLQNQFLIRSGLTSPQQVVKSMLAMQSQEYAMAKWAIALRLPKSTHASIEKAFNEGKILRTHILRPTWHFVSPDDIRWLLQLTAPRIRAVSNPYFKKYSLDQKLFNKVNTIFEKELREKNFLTRTELKSVLEQKKIKAPDSISLSYIFMQAELEQIICSGPRKGKQFSYALFDEVTTTAREFDRPKALEELCLRFFKTRGPANIKDCAIWSGLTAKDIRDGIEMNGAKLESAPYDGVDYYFVTGLRDSKPLPVTSVNFLLPDYDEYGVSYKNESFALNFIRRRGKPMDLFNHKYVLDGLLAGDWKLNKAGTRIDVEVQSGTDLSASKKIKLDKAVEKYKKFFKNVEAAEE